MKTWINVMIVAAGIGVGVSAWSATELYFSNNVAKQPKSLTLQIMQAQFQLDRSSVAKATQAKTFDHKPAILVVMTEKGAAALDKLLRGNEGRVLTLVWNNNVISQVNIAGLLGKEFQIVGFTPQQSQTFLKLFKNNDSAQTNDLLIPGLEILSVIIPGFLDLKKLDTRN
jgi:hypothetical protein